MRPPSLRTTVAVLTLLAPGAAAGFIGCSSSKGGGSGGGPDASEGSVFESGVPDTGDASVTHDGSVSDAADGGEASSGDAAEASAGDTGADTGVGFADGGDFSGDCGVGSVGEPTDLRCTGLYGDWTSKTIATGVVEYDPGLHLWSDGADKTRWIYLPPGQKIDTSDMDEWTFPVGTKVWKEFRLVLGDGGTDGGAETRIETRMIWKQAVGEWYRTTYRWTDDGVSDATELTSGQTDVAGTTYQIPTQDECDDCHNGRMDGVMGFEAVALSSPLASGLTMQALTSQGLLTAPPAAPLVIPGSTSDAAVLGWLHMNCGVSCHNRGDGEAAQTNFYMRLDVAKLATEQATDTYTTGWNVPTQNFNIPDAGTTYRFHACDVGSSAAYYRADVRNGVDGVPLGVQMPPQITHEVDQADMAAMAAWINGGCDAGAD
jgi:hypothetical protein